MTIHPKVQSQVDRLARFISGPLIREVPKALRRPYTESEWATLTDAERRAIILACVTADHEFAAASTPTPQAKQTHPPLDSSAPAPATARPWIYATDTVRGAEPQHYAACVGGCGRMLAARPDRPSLRECGVSDGNHTTGEKRRRHSTPRVATPTPAL
ncbi:hypothetical protein ITJ38_10055 [Agreia pratensis]|uniref:hypothetical protein n=1 Tax=Agreia pratensis TaxID=150121 RepID=UPI00188A9D2C|nr:hypothetical protein [Agreia pratensis]MBF4634743.1 hypothetical protein [Agreia pratensis]